MNSKLFRKIAPVVLAAALLAMVSSCNRGVGCPNNFSIDATEVEVLD